MPAQPTGRAEHRERAVHDAPDQRPRRPHLHRAVRRPPLRGATSGGERRPATRDEIFSAAGRGAPGLPARRPGGGDRRLRRRLRAARRSPSPTRWGCTCARSTTDLSPDPGRAAARRSGSAGAAARRACASGWSSGRATTTTRSSTTSWSPSAPPTEPLTGGYQLLQQLEIGPLIVAASGSPTRPTTSSWTWRGPTADRSSAATRTSCDVGARAEGGATTAEHGGRTDRAAHGAPPRAEPLAELQEGIYHAPGAAARAASSRSSSCGRERSAAGGGRRVLGELWDDVPGAEGRPRARSAGGVAAAAGTTLQRAARVRAATRSTLEGAALPLPRRARRADALPLPEGRRRRAAAARRRPALRAGRAREPGDRGDRVQVDRRQPSWRSTGRSSRPGSSCTTAPTRRPGRRRSSCARSTSASSATTAAAGSTSTTGCPTSRATSARR